MPPLKNQKVNVDKNGNISKGFLVFSGARGWYKMGILARNELQLDLSGQTLT